MSAGFLQLLIFAGAAVSAVTAILVSVAPQWRRIVRLALGHVEQPDERDRWRRMHMEADRRRPFQIRAVPPRAHPFRGLLGRRTR